MENEQGERGRQEQKYQRVLDIVGSIPELSITYLSLALGGRHLGLHRLGLKEGLPGFRLLLLHCRAPGR